MLYRYLPDLTPFPAALPPEADATDPAPAFAVFAVGWLDAGHEYPVARDGGGGAEPMPPIDREQFLDALFALCLRPVLRTRGVTPCPLCASEGRSGGPVAARRGGKLRMLGSAEIEAAGADEVRYRAPDLIYHYVAEHGYQPPGPFVTALTASTTAER